MLQQILNTIYEIYKDCIIYSIRSYTIYHSMKIRFNFSYNNDNFTYSYYSVN